MPDGRTVDAGFGVGTSDEMLQLLVDSVSDYAIFLLEPDGTIVSWNAGAVRIKGYAASEIIGRHFSVFYSEEDVQSGKPDWELVVAADSGRFEDEGWRVRKDGTTFWANVVITALRDKGGTLRGFGKVTRDLTARRDAELQRIERERQEADTLRRHAFRLGELERTKTEFLNLASHELRGPLAVARGYVSMLLDGDLTPDQFAERAQIVGTRLGQIENLVQKMLETARLEYGQLDLTLGKVDLREVVMHQVDEMTPLIIDSNHVVTVELASKVPIITGDPDRLGTVVQNLLDNAVKYSPKGGPVTVKVATSPSRVFVSVADEGVGIDQEDLPKLFTRFKRLHEVELANVGGTGLGLYLAREIIRQHHGDILVESRLGEGSRFTLSIPIDEVAPDKRGRARISH